MVMDAIASSSGKYIISNAAYAKIVLHAAKFPDAMVGGFALGSGQEGITDVIPVFHEVPIGPILENAATVSDSVKRQDEAVVGFYFVNTVAAGDALPFFIEPILSELKRNTGASVLLTIDSDRLAGADNGSLCIKSQTDGGNVQDCTAAASTTNAKMNAMLDALIKANAQTKLSDFADHMNYVRGDFRNAQVEEEIMAVL